MEFVEKYYKGESTGGLLPRCAGKRIGAQSHSFGPAARDHFWIIYIDEGEGVLNVDDDTYILSAGDVILQYPDQPIAYRADPGSVWTLYWLCLDRPPDGKTASDIGMSENCPVLRRQSRNLSRLFLELTEVISEGTISSEYICHGLIYRIFAELVTEDGGNQTDEIDDAVRFMRVNYDRPISVSDASDEVGLELSVFSRRFKSRMAVSPGRWLENLRLDKARELLAGTSMKIQDVALSSGYSDPLYFSRRFSERYGLSPTEFRKTRNSGI